MSFQNRKKGPLARTWEAKHGTRLQNPELLAVSSRGWVITLVVLGE